MVQSVMVMALSLGRCVTCVVTCIVTCVVCFLQQLAYVLDHFIREFIK